MSSALDTPAPGLELRRKGALLNLAFHAPSTRNAMNGALALALSALSDRLLVGELLEGVALLVLSSDIPGIFVSGGDLQCLSRMSAEEGDAFTSHMRRFCKSLSQLPVPSVALLGGGAWGGGSEMALATDLRVWCGHSASLHFWQTKYAVPGGWGGMKRLQELSGRSPRRVGLAFVLQESLGVEEARRWGLVDGAVASEDEGWALCESWARSVAETTPALVKGLLQRPQGTWDSVLAYDESLFAGHWLGSIHKERIRRFLERKR